MSDIIYLKGRSPCIINKPIIMWSDQEIKIGIDFCTLRMLMVGELKNNECKIRDN